MTKYDGILRHDIRVTEQLRRRGLLTADEMQKNLAALEDAAANVDYLPAHDESAGTVKTTGPRPTFEAA